MTLKVREGRALDEPTREFLKWVEDLKRVRDEFEALLNEYDEKRQRLIQAANE
jgi:hypothetical protein